MSNSTTFSYTTGICYSTSSNRANTVIGADSHIIKNNITGQLTSLHLLGDIATVRPLKNKKISKIIQLELKYNQQAIQG